MNKNIGEIKQQQQEDDEQLNVYTSGVYSKYPIELKINKQTIEQLQSNEMKEKIQMQINNYYKDKSKYEKKIQELKNKLRKSKDLSTRDKRREFKNGLKCIKCGKKGGTLFTNENNILREVCKADVPCSLNIEIKRTTVDNLIDLEKRYSRELNEAKKQIVIANLDLLFKYKSKNEIATLFNDTLNVSLEKSTENLRSCSELLSSILNKNKEAIIKKEETLKLEIKELSTAVGEKIIVDKYIRFILPLLKELRELKYGYSGTECESTLQETPCSQAKDNIYAVQIPFTIKDMELENRKEINNVK